MKHIVRWVAPSPLWGRFEAEPGSREALRAEDQARPAILRFASDNFMDQLIAMLEADPRQIDTLIARPETWRGPSDEAPDLIARERRPRFARGLARLLAAKAPPKRVEATCSEISALENGVQRKKMLKLFHPAHQRFYLVAANLVCEKVGLPDRAVHSGGSEQIGFVLRRLFPAKAPTEPGQFDEYAFIKDSGGARWQRIDADATTAGTTQLASGEEMLPLFPLNFRDDANHPRRLLAGLVPVGRREEYMGVAKREAPTAGTTATAVLDSAVGDTQSVLTARKEQFKMDVAEPWKNVIRSVYAAAARICDESAGHAPSSALKPIAAKAANDQAQGQSWLILLDFGDYLKQHLEPVWNAVLAPPYQRIDLQTTEQQSLFAWLDSTGVAIGGPISVQPYALSLRDALRRMHVDPVVRANLEAATRPFPEPIINDGLAWPAFACPLAGIDKNLAPQSVLTSLAIQGTTNPDDDEASAPVLSSDLKDVEDQVAKIDTLVQLVIQAIDIAEPARPTPPLPFALQVRDAIKSTLDDPGRFVIRCAYLRCDCGPVAPAVLSPPSQRFQLASFFDPDAPARPIRISLPLDTTAAGLRKHSKGTAFVISDVLCGQIQRAKGLGLGDLVLSVLPWPFHKDLDVKGLASCERGGNSLGMICSLSIPIITLCALILLMIIVSLLDFIFKWMPWFVMCFPIPKLKAKKPDGDSP